MFLKCLIFFIQFINLLWIFTIRSATFKTIFTSGYLYCLLTTRIKICNFFCRYRSRFSFCLIFNLFSIPTNSRKSLCRSNHTLLYLGKFSLQLIMKIIFLMTLNYLLKLLCHPLGTNTFQKLLLFLSTQLTKSRIQILIQWLKFYWTTTHFSCLIIFLIHNYSSFFDLFIQMLFKCFILPKFFEFFCYFFSIINWKSLWL